VSYAIPVGLTAATFSRGGLNWQGRYGMTFTAGLLLLFGLALERGGAPPVRSLTVVVLMAWMVMQFVGQRDVLGRQSPDPVLAQTGWWPPPVALILDLAVCATCAWLRVLSVKIRTTAPNVAMPEAPKSANLRDLDPERVR
jgi:hypothetical protein